MNKLALLFLASVTSGILVAADGASSDGRPSAEEMKEMRAARRIKAMNETGGFIADTRYASGKYVFVNAQKSVSEKSIIEAAGRCQNSCFILVAVTNGVPVDCCSAQATFNSLGANMAAFLVEDSKLPLSIHSPEGRWAIINVSALKKDSPSAEALESRLRKMMTRTFALQFQSGYSISPKSTVQVITRAEELDKIDTEGIATDCQTVVQRTAPQFGFVVMKRVFYRKALEEGWAPEPVSEIQRKCKELWEKERQGEPTAPLAIKFDEKTGGTVK